MPMIISVNMETMYSELYLLQIAAPYTNFVKLHNPKGFCHPIDNNFHPLILSRFIHIFEVFIILELLQTNCMRFECHYSRYSIYNIGAAGIDIYANVGSSYQSWHNLHASRKQAMLSRVQ